MVYHLDLPGQLANIHEVFHVSMLRNYVRDEDQVVFVDLSDLDVHPIVIVSINPLWIIGIQENNTYNKVFKTLKVQWSEKNEMSLVRQ